MEERIVQFRVGVMIFATLIITAILAVMFGEMPRWAGKYSVYVRFPEAPGVSSGTPVRKSGIRIGEVTAIEFASEALGNPNEQGVIVTAEIDANRKLYHNELCLVRRNLLGDSELQFVLRDQPALDNRQIDASQLSPKKPLEGMVYRDPMTVVADLQTDLGKAIGSVVDTSDEMRKVVVQVQTLLEKNEDAISDVVVKAGQTLDSVRQTADNANRIIGDEQTQAQVREALARMPAVLKDAQETVARMGDTMSLVDRNLRNMEGFTQPLGERGGDLIVRLDEGTRKLDQVMGEMLQFSQALNDPNGTVGQLMTNPELYHHLSRAAQNVDELTRQLKPIVADARVITDKVARHPGVILRDAVKPGAGIK